METPNPTEIPVEIKLLQKKAQLIVKYDDNTVFTFSCKFLRLNSPSADVKGHGAEKPPPPKISPDINIIQIDPVGHYAIRLHFNDGHQSGLFSWHYLYELGLKY